MEHDELEIPHALLAALEDLSAEVSVIADMLALIAGSKGDFGALSGSFCEPTH